MKFFTLFTVIINLIFLYSTEAKGFKSKLPEAVSLKHQILLPAKKITIIATEKKVDHSCDLMALNHQTNDQIINSNEIFLLAKDKVRADVFRLEPGFPEVEAITLIPMKHHGKNIELAIRCESSLFMSAAEAKHYVIAPTKAIKLFSNELHY